MIFKLKNLHKFFFTYICPTFYSGSPPPAPTNTTQTQNINSIPEQLMPFALGNLQAAKKQLFTTDSKGKITGYQPYTPYSTDANKYVAGFSGMQTQAQQGAANLQMPGQMGAATGLAGASSLGALGAGNQYAQQATDPNSIAAYMSPYMQNVTDYQTQQANRQFDITGAQQMSAGTRAGAFGGSREALMAAENERNRNQAITGIQATNSQNAFQNAQSAQQFGANLGLQGYQTGLQGAQLLGNLGEQQLGMETGILNTQNQYGAEQQAREQALINQNIKNYENEQNQPYRAMTMFSDLVRGTPTNQSSSTAYTSVANPSYAQQIGGLLGTAGSLYGAYKGKANGGIVQAYAGGGVTETVESSMEAKLRDMSPEQLRAYLPSITSQEELNIAKMILAEEVPQMATGGIVGYSGRDGSLVEENPKTEEEILMWEKTHGLPFERKKQTEVGAKTPILVSDSALPIANKGITSVPEIKEPVSQIGQVAPMSEDYDNPIYTNRKSSGIKDEAVTNIPDYALSEVGKATKAAGMEEPITPVINLEEPAVQQAPEDDGLSEQRATAAKTPLQIMEEQNAEREKAGIKSPDQISAEQRKEIMAEKSNIGEESKRQMYLRMAEFFSNWGSTPGLPLVAGLKAMKDTIPGVMSDSKEDHAAYKAVNKSLRDLEHATELEKAGHFDKAYAIKEQASATVLKHKEKVADWAHDEHLRQIDIASREKVAGMNVGAQMAGHAMTLKNRAEGSSKFNASSYSPVYTAKTKRIAEIRPLISDLKGSTSPEDKAELKALQDEYATLSEEAKQIEEVMLREGRGGYVAPPLSKKIESDADRAARIAASLAKTGG